VKKNSKRDQKIIDQFKSDRDTDRDYWDPIYKECQEHASFTLEGKQLKDEDWSAMGVTKPKQPNLLITYANHEANKTLQTDYKIKVSPNGSGASVAAARERQEVLRGLQRKNNINQIFNQVRRLQVAGGIAYSIAILDYAGKRGFGKTLDDEFLEDWKSVYPDRDAKNATLSDMKRFTIKKTVPKSAWEDETGEEPKGWGQKKEKDLWYYWVREDIRDKEYLMEDGESRSMGSKLNGDLSKVKLDEDGEPLHRPTEDYSWCWYKISEDDVILQEQSWKGSHPPLVACTGRKVVDAGGKVHYQPLTQFAEEPQIIYTLIENIVALRLNRSPFSKWLVALESVNVKDMEKIRRAAMMGDLDILYKSVDDSGNAIPPPTEIQPYILDPELIALQREQEVKIQKIFGIFDANLGNKSNEQSGVAIRERAQGGELSNFDLQFQYMEYVEQVGRVKLDLIPKYMTAAQQVAFVDEDDNTVLKWLNMTGGVQFSPDEEYSLSVEAMPISQTAREDEFAALIDAAKVLPSLQTNPTVAALIIKSMPGRYSQQISEAITQGDPRVAELQHALQEAQGQLQQAQAKQMQDQIALAGMKQQVQATKIQMTLLKQMQAIQGQTAEAQQAFKDMETMGSASIEAMELQIKQFEAQSKADIGAKDSESKRISAEASMIIAVDKASRPDPQPKPVGAPA
jgi:hypothetical protein